MKRQVIIVGVIAAITFILGYFSGKYVTENKYEYLRGYTGANEAFIALEMLDNGRTNRLRQFYELQLLGACRVLDQVPQWAHRYNPGDPERAIPEKRMETRRSAVRSAAALPLASDYGMSQEAMEAILRENFSHYDREPGLLGYRYEVIEPPKSK